MTLVAATLDQRGRGPTDSVMMNLQVAGPVNSAPGFRGWASDDEDLVAVSLCSHAGLHDSGGQQNFIPVAVESVAFHENKNGQLSEANGLGLRSGASHSYQGIGGESGVRRLTPRECERLQGFPDDWTLYDIDSKVISDSARYRMLGNAVAVPCAEWLGRRILEAEARPIRP